MEINKKVKIYTKSNIQELKEDKPQLDDNQLYVYVLLNSPQGNIKIGKTTNIQQRHQSLQGSNGGGNKIIACYCSPATYMSSMEKICHAHYEWCRIQGTEWFDGSKITFQEVVEYVDGLFSSKDFENCNALRKTIIEEMRNK